MPFRFTATTGALPTGYALNTTYYIIAVGFGVNSFRLSATPGGAAINTSGSQSGVHTAMANFVMWKSRCRIWIPWAAGQTVQAPDTASISRIFHGGSLRQGAFGDIYMCTAAPGPTGSIIPSGYGTGISDGVCSWDWVCGPPDNTANDFIGRDAPAATYQFANIFMVTRVDFDGTAPLGNRMRGYVSLAEGIHMAGPAQIQGGGGHRLYIWEGGPSAQFAVHHAPPPLTAAVDLYYGMIGQDHQYLWYDTMLVPHINLNPGTKWRHAAAEGSAYRGVVNGLCYRSDAHWVQEGSTLDWDMDTGLGGGSVEGRMGRLVSASPGATVTCQSRVFRQLLGDLLIGDELVRGDGANVNFLASSVTGGHRIIGTKYNFRNGCRVNCPTPGDINSFFGSSDGTLTSSWLEGVLKWADAVGTAIYAPPSLADGAGATTTVTVPGAALGDLAQASFSLDLRGVALTVWVSRANTVSVRFRNETGGTLELASGTLKAVVYKVS